MSTPQNRKSDGTAPASPSPSFSPHSEDAQKGLLCSVLLDPGILPQVLRTVSRNAFYPSNGSEQILFDLMLALHGREKPIDIVALTHEARENGKADAVAPWYLADLQGFVPTSSNWDYYADVMLDKQRERQIHMAMKQLQASNLESPNAREEMLERLREVVESRPRPALPPLPDIWHTPEGKWLIPNPQGGWTATTQKNAVLQLRKAGYNGAIPPGHSISNIESALLQIVQTRTVAYSGPLAGHRRGHANVCGHPVLITTSPAIIEPKPGPFDTIDAFLAELLINPKDYDNKPLDTVLCWLSLSVKALASGTNRPAQALALCGPPGGGKTLLQSIITELLGGREADPFAWMTAETDFNGEILKSEHLAISDKRGHKDSLARSAFGNSIKGICVNERQRMRCLYAEGMTVAPFWRLTISLNDEPEDMLILPQMVPGMADKLHLLRTYPTPQHSALWEREGFADWRKRIRTELPAFVHFLHALEVPPTFSDVRYGVRTHHDAELLDKLEGQNPALVLMEIIDSELFPLGSLRTDTPGEHAHPERPLGGWTGTAAQIERWITRPAAESAHQARKLLSWNNAAGSHLGRLARLIPDRIQPAARKAGNRQRMWHITAPNTSTNLAQNAN